MKKKISHPLRLILATSFLSLFIMATKIPEKAKQVKENDDAALTCGYALIALSGGDYLWADCGDTVHVFVSNPSHEIDTGTTIYSKYTCSSQLPFADMIITSTSGSTSGKSFYVINSVVGAETTSECP